jgi:hypothetical protein
MGSREPRFADRARPAIAAALAGAFAASCASHQADERVKPAVSAVASAAPAPPKAVGYDVHEWGLVREDQNATLRVGAVAPPREQEIIVITKPVLYFHADELLTLKRVAVDVPGGHIVETWPLARPATEKDTFEWRDVAVDPKSACKSSNLPRKIDPPCSTLAANDPCESAGLATVRSFDSSCVRVGGATETFLFYRGSTASVSPPLRFKAEANGDVTVENEGDLPIPGLLVRIETADRKTRTLSVRPPAPHASIVVGHDFPTDESKSPFARPDEPVEGFRGTPPPQVVTGPAREDIRTSMHEVGLLDTEVDAFMKSWDDELFGVVIHNGSPVTEPQTTFLYFLPEASIPRYAEVHFDPPPRTFRRALAVWTRLSTSGWGH